MKPFYRSVNLDTQNEVLLFFHDAIQYREGHKKESEKIARFVFDATHQSKLKTPLPPDLEKIRYEFGALEAPGQSEEGEDLEAFTDQLWKRLYLIIEKVSKKKRTV